MQRPTTYTVDEAQKAMEIFCAYQERCHYEVRKKLREMRMIPQAIDHILTQLIESNYLNEERFAKAFARGKFRIKHWGKNRIVRELKFREISKYNIESALKEIPQQDYLDALDALAKKKMDSILERSVLKKKKKLVDYLLYRGWEPHLVYDKVNELMP
ncbi:MAG: regulatory protein RecX [Flavobacteriaceae bacterium]|nr:RecX family transcriptional regulator [Mangrovimonas sp.]MCB0437327.1 RecX family transcriptional regulator [Mangrovimonas sp.]HPF97530.1 regulatory protein RecX [Mangrovimonas sp.]